MIKLTPEKPPYYEQGVYIKTYRALISQEDTNAPTIIMQGINTIGDIVWTRQGTGQYWGTLVGQFGQAKTSVYTGNGATNALITTSATDDRVVINVQTIVTQALADNLLFNTPIEIHVITQ